MGKDRKFLTREVFRLAFSRLELSFDCRRPSHAHRTGDRMEYEKFLGNIEMLATLASVGRGYLGALLVLGNKLSALDPN